MSSSIKLNGKEYIPVDTIKRFRPLTDEDKAKASERLEIDATVFNTRVDYKDGSQSLARETIDDIKGMLAVVNIGADRFVPAANIIKAEAFTKDDAAKAEGKGITLGHTFRSRVETTAGPVLSLATAQQIIDRRAKALGQSAKTPKAE